MENPPDSDSDTQLVRTHTLASLMAFLLPAPLVLTEASEQPTSPDSSQGSFIKPEDAPPSRAGGGQRSGKSLFPREPGRGAQLKAGPVSLSRERHVALSVPGFPALRPSRVGALRRLARWSKGNYPYRCHWGTLPGCRGTDKMGPRSSATGVSCTNINHSGANPSCQPLSEAACSPG